MRANSRVLDVCAMWIIEKRFRPDQKSRSHPQIDEQWSGDSGFVRYDFTKPEEARCSCLASCQCILSRLSDALGRLPAAHR